MRVNYALLFLISHLVFISAENTTPQQLLQNAQTWEDVDENAKARAIYEKLLTLPLSPWEKAVVRYNLGNAYLLEKNWTAAIQQFNEIESRKNLSPELLSRLKQNSALALLLRSEEFLPSLQENHGSAAQMMAALSLLREGKKQAEESKNVECILRQWQGYSRCPENTILHQIDSEIHQHLQWMQRRKEQLLAQHLAALRHLMATSSSLSPLLPKLQSMIASLSQFLDHPDSPLTPLSSLKSDLNVLSPLISEEKGHEAWKQKTLLKVRDLQALFDLALKKFDNGQKKNGVFFLTALQQSLYTLLKGYLALSHSTTPESFLKNLIEAERNALNLSLLADPLASHDFLSADEKMVVFHEQQAVAAQAIQFLPLVLQWQTAQFQREGSQNNCQQKPWDEVLPYFFQGYQNASDAAQEFQPPHEAYVLAIDHQKEALKNWMESLNLIHTFDSQEKSTSSQNSSQKNIRDDLLDRLMDMHLEDQFQKKPQKSPAEMVERPW